MIFQMESPIDHLGRKPEPRVQLPDILLAARDRAQREGLKYSGQVGAKDAWHLLSHGQAQLVDVRSAEELLFVGEVPHSLNVVWQKGPTLIDNPRFLQQLQRVGKRAAPLLFLCCCGKRSAAAAEAATAARFQYVFTVADGFEGIHPNCALRGHSGWKRSGMPWVGGE